MIEEAHWKGHTEKAVMGRYHRMLRSVVDANYFWPIIDVHPDIISLPAEVRHDPEIARAALQDAIPKIRKDLAMLAKSKDPRVRRAFQEYRKTFNRRLERKNLIKFEVLPKSSHLVGGRTSSRSFAFVPRQDAFPELRKPDNNYYWYQQKVGDNPLESLVMARWVLAYHDRLLALLEKK